MKNILFIIGSICIILIIIYYIDQDVTKIYNKNILKDDYLITNDNKIINSKYIKDIISDKNITWSFSIASYAYNFLARSKKNDFTITLYDDKSPLIIIYKHDLYGFVQLKSNKVFIGLYDRLKKLGKDGGLKYDNHF